LELWLDYLVDNPRFVTLELFKQGGAAPGDLIAITNKKTKVQYVFQSAKWFAESYEAYCRDKKYKFGDNNVLKFLQAKGFAYTKTAMRGYRISMEAFRALANDAAERSEEEEDEWE
jgi:hypothetical protein